MILTVTLNPAIDKVYSIDDFIVGKVFRPKKMTTTAGGKGVNVTRVLSLVGEEVTATGFIGGSNGKYIKNELEKLKVKSEFSNIYGDTRICVNITDEKNIMSTEILEKGPLVSEAEIESFLTKYKNLVKSSSVITASGSLPWGVPIDFYRKLIKISKDNNKIFLLDTSGESLKEGIKEKPYLIKPNSDEIEVIIGSIEKNIYGYKKALEYLKNEGIKLPLLTLGKDGAIAMIEDEILKFTIEPINVINAVGSGDSFLGGLATGIRRGYSKIDTIKYGMACGISNTQFFETGMVSEDQINKYFKIIKINKI